MNILTKVLIRARKNGPNHTHSQIRVALSERGGEWLYEKRGNLYRAENGDVGAFYYYDKPGSGYNGSKRQIKMTDGSIVDLVGPMSSNAGAINKAFADREPLVECVTDYLSCRISIRKDALEKFGLQFMLNDNSYFLTDELIRSVLDNNTLDEYGNHIKEFS